MARPASADRSVSASRAARLPVWKLALFSLLPAVALLGAGELAVRLAGLARPSLQSMPLPEEAAGLLRQDPELFWSLRPGARVEWKGHLATINSLGLRGPELGPKRRDEYRILSLGESTTFGVGVATDATYSAVLERLLRERFPARRFTVINAGVPAWSSFQSLKFLELRGFSLQPDMVLFYHEVNDYLPSALRDASNTEIGLLKTDRELYEARASRWHRLMMRASALYRFAAYRLASWRIARFDVTRFDNPLLTIGLPDITLQPRVARSADPRRPASELNQMALGRRVSDEERRQILEQLAALCAERGIALIVIHPAYRDSRPHDCSLTRFCRERGVTLLDAYDSLHPPGQPAGIGFLDSMHPDPAGHQRLAIALYGPVAERIAGEPAVGGD